MTNLKDKLKNSWKWVKENPLPAVYIAGIFSISLTYGVVEYSKTKYETIKKIKWEKIKEQEHYNELWKEISGYADSDKNKIISFEEEAELYRKMEIFDENKIVYRKTESPKPTKSNLMRGIFNYQREAEKKYIKEMMETEGSWMQEIK